MLATYYIVQGYAGWNYCKPKYILTIDTNALYNVLVLTMLSENATHYVNIDIISVTESS